MHHTAANTAMTVRYEPPATSATCTLMGAARIQPGRYKGNAGNRQIIIQVVPRAIL